MTISRGGLSEWRAGWKVAFAAGLGNSMAGFISYSSGVFIPAIEHDSGWGRTDISLGVTLFSIVGIILSPFCGALLSRWGIRRTAIVGTLSFSAGIAILAFATASVWTWWLLWIVFSVASMPTKPLLWATAINVRFRDSRALAIGLMLCGSGLMATVLPLSANLLVTHFGWRTAYMAIGAAYAILITPVLMAFFDRDLGFGGAAQHPTPTPLVWTAVISHRSLLRLFFAAVLINIAVSGCMFHLVLILTLPLGNQSQAVEIASTVGIVSTLSRLGFGWLMDRVRRPWMGAVACSAVALAFGLLLLPGTPATSLAAVIALGIGLGAELDAIIYLSSRYLPQEHFPQLFSWIQTGVLLGVAVGPLTSAAVFDTTRNYDLFFMIAGLAALCAGLLLNSLRGTNTATAALAPGA